MSCSRRENCRHTPRAVWDAFRYILSWYNPQFGVFRSVRLQRVTMTTGINPWEGRGSASRSWKHTSTDRERENRVQRCALLWSEDWLPDDKLRQWTHTQLGRVSGIRSERVKQRTHFALKKKFFFFKSDTKNHESAPREFCQGSDWTS